jgi:wyosine [tRNA(Phe)-imidazoG37] synthetase (radical SAM superfamily)
MDAMALRQREYRYIFGPVLSRRLGRSLGVDLMPFKTCNYDCIYCEQGRTTHHTNSRKNYVPVALILEELSHFLASNPEPDYVTLSGAGEPTLHAGLGEIVQGIKTMTDIPLALITNGSLLCDPALRDDLRRVDLVMPSLDAGNASLFNYINRPVTGISFDEMLNGLIAFRDSFPKQIWLEVMLLAGVSSGESEVREIAECVRRIRPDRVQLNTVVRPPSETFALPVSNNRLEILAELFIPRAEVIAEYKGPSYQLESSPKATQVLELLERRPCTLKEIAGALGLRMMETAKLLQYLAEQNIIVEKRFENDTFFMMLHEDKKEAIK